MNELSELEQRILSELEEFGERDIVPLINVALTTSGSDRDIEALTEALSQLLRRGLIEIGCLLAELSGWSGRAAA